MTRYKATNAATTAPETPPFPCPGFHNDPWRYTEDPGDEHDHPDNYAHGKPIWCERCTDRLRSILTYLPTLADNLLGEIDDGTAPHTERVSGTRAPAIHRQQAHAFLLDNIRDILTQWEDEVRAARAFTPRPTGIRQLPAIRSASAFLLAHLEWILTKAPGCDDPQGLVRAFVDKVHHLDRQGMYLTQNDEPQPIECVGVRCKGCSQFALVRGVDRSGVQADEVRCENCGARMTLNEYEEQAERWALYEYAHLPEDARDSELARPIAAFERARGIA